MTNSLNSSRLIAACLLLISLAAARLVNAQDNPSTAKSPTAKSLMASPAEYEVYQWLLARADKQEHVELKPDGKLAWLGFAGENRYTCSLQLDEQGYVVQATFNQAGFYNEELEKLAACKKLRKLTAWHNFRKGELHKYREGKNPTSGAGIGAFRGGALESINFGGSPFDDQGIQAAVSVPTLKELIIYHTRVTDQGCQHLRGDDHIEYLRLGPQFSLRITDACLEHVASMNALKHLEINETHLSWNGLQHLTKLQGTLEKITFGEDWIGAEDLAKLRAALPNVTIEHTPAKAEHVEKMKRIEQRQAEQQD